MRLFVKTKYRKLLMLPLLVVCVTSISIYVRFQVNFLIPVYITSSFLLVAGAIFLTWVDFKYGR